MRTINPLLLLFVSLIVAGPVPAKDKGKTPELKVLPKLSESGYKRLRKNIQAIDKNIELVRQNLETIDRNLETIQHEVEELDKLADENRNLINNYQSYLSKALSEEQKNKAALKKLIAWKKQLSASLNPKNAISEARDQLKKADEEITNRQMWEKDAAAKVARARELMGELKNNQAKINAKKSALAVEVQLWQTRSKNYRTMLVELEKDRTSYSQILARSPYY